MSTAEVLPAGDPARSQREVPAEDGLTIYPVRLFPAPIAAPPFDDERDTTPSSTVVSLPGLSDPRRGGARALALTLPIAPPSSAVPRLRLVPPPAAVPSRDRHQAGEWCARFVRVVVETLSGLRPVSQLGAWATPEVCRLLARRVAIAARCHPGSRATGAVRSVHLSAPAPDVAEVCAVVQFDARVRALALRVESEGAAWRCTTLQLG